VFSKPQIILVVQERLCTSKSTLEKLEVIEEQLDKIIKESSNVMDTLSPIEV